MLVQERFRKACHGSVAEVWVDLGMLRYGVELYENGALAERQSGWRPSGEIEAHLVARDFAVLVRIDAVGKVACTWAN